jgi:hypothetical protein
VCAVLRLMEAERTFQRVTAGTGGCVYFVPVAALPASALPYIAR